ncbi:MAG: ATP-dependent DNA helicase RecG [Thiohalomonadaceae bacterium]
MHNSPAPPLTALKGVGPRMAARLELLGLHSLSDLLFHLPLRYQDRTRLSPIGGLRPGYEAVIEGEIQHTEIKYGRRRMLLSYLADASGGISLRFFHFSAAMQNTLAQGQRVRCYGEVRPGLAGLEMVHPEFHRVDEHIPTAVADHLTPIYPATEGLQQTTLRKLSEQALQWLQQGRVSLIDYLPAEWLQDRNFLSLQEALTYLHRPPPDAPLALLEEAAHPAQRRLAFEELLAHTLSLRRLHRQAQQHSAPRLSASGQLQQSFLQALPFALTSAQQRVQAEIAADLRQGHPMQRLVQGDVGSGKTVIAALAALQATEAGYQSVIMAPTELLAEQHFHQFQSWFAPLGINVTWLIGKLKAKQRQDSLAQLANGSASIAVGTHALFQQDVEFHDLGLVIIDEQHRFGVHQRLALREKGKHGQRYPHQLIMTATPIPRTLAMTAYADLDCSIIDELPPGRTPVETVVVPDTRRAEVIARVHNACRAGRQAYWVCTLIGESETLAAQAAEDTASQLITALGDLRIALVHGRLKPNEKEQVMSSFKQGEIDLLVATTVIEVGVDVPNASLMIIENAERLGLAQLHQLRGRVGRGHAESHCVLMYHAPLSAQGKERLAIMRATTDGFEIARKDLELRGPGEVLGTRQTGLWQLRIADLQRDQALLTEAHHYADELLESASERAEHLIHRWLGNASQYGEV